QLGALEGLAEVVSAGHLFGQRKSGQILGILVLLRERPGHLGVVRPDDGVVPVRAEDRRERSAPASSADHRRPHAGIMPGSAAARPARQRRAPAPRPSRRATPPRRSGRSLPPRTARSPAPGWPPIATLP